MFKKIARRLIQINRYFFYQEYLTNLKINHYCQSQLGPLIYNHPYLPVSGMSLEFKNIAYIINDITLNNRKEIIEFGSGISTIIIARLIKLNNLDCKLTSIDNNATWIEKIADSLKKEQLDEYVKLVLAPLVSEESTPAKKWYSKDVLNSIKNNTYDLAIVDGPIMSGSAFKLIRYPALPFLYSMMAENCRVILDDANRIGENEIMQIWKTNYPQFDVTIINSSIAVFSRGHSFECVPLKYDLKF